MPKVIIDIGHLDNDAGAVANGLREDVLNKAVASFIIPELQRHNVTVIVTTGTLQNRVDIEHREKPNYFVSIHHNAGGGDGFEVYCYSRGGESERLAKLIHDEVISANLNNSRGVKTANYMVLRETWCAACLVEVAFMDTKDIECADEEHEQKAFGIAIAKGILKALNIEYIQPKPVYNVPSDFIEEVYLELNPDVKHAVENKLYGLTSGAMHYATQGVIEGRIYKKEVVVQQQQKTPIMAQSQISAEQMVTCLLKNNPTPKLMGMNPLDFCKLFIEEGNIEGVRGDIAFCQSVHETGWFAFKGDVVPEQHNYAGIGTTGGGVKGHYFKDQREGIKAQIQHCKGYATKEPLKETCVDPRYHLVSKGIAPTWEDLGGKWAVPGYPRTKYTSFDEAFKNGETYGQMIMKLYDKLVNTPIDNELINTLKPKKYQVITNYLPKNAQNEIHIQSILNKYFTNVKVLIKHNEHGIWIVTDFISKEKATEIHELLKADNLQWEIKEV